MAGNNNPFDLGGNPDSQQLYNWEQYLKTKRWQPKPVRQLGGSGDPNYSGGMLSDRGPRSGGGFAKPGNVGLGYDFGGSSMTNPAKEISHLTRGMNTVGGLLGAAGNAITGVKDYSRNLQRLQGVGQNKDVENKSQKEEPAAAPPKSRTLQRMPQSPIGSAPWDFSKAPDRDTVAGWKNENINDFNGYSAFALRGMRSVAQQQRAEAVSRSGGSPSSLPAPNPGRAAEAFQFARSLTGSGEMLRLDKQEAGPPKPLVSAQEEADMAATKKQMMAGPEPKKGKAATSAEFPAATKKDPGNKSKKVKK
jgi:hypothetical protein